MSRFFDSQCSTSTSSSTTSSYFPVAQSQFEVSFN